MDVCLTFPERRILLNLQNGTIKWITLCEID